MIELMKLYAPIQPKICYKRHFVQSLLRNHDMHLMEDRMGTMTHENDMDLPVRIQGHFS